MKLLLDVSRCRILGKRCISVSAAPQWPCDKVPRVGVQRPHPLKGVRNAPRLFH